MPSRHALASQFGKRFIRRFVHPASAKAEGNFEVVDRPVPDPGKGQVRIKVDRDAAC
jgi:hypothetical protein